eukprot:TRINITY_DN51257_c0_g1_i1.p1 TRINITY_DN51257_c0_g1~~TRINITY_DN51257_c0_g1_i1.p1  ORF type:complete len:373 (+),score=71.99 TRINITY_DN51257_c0_g1_i1:86-1204(+)
MQRPHSGKALTVKGTRFFRYRIACALLSGRTVVFDDIRTQGEEVGLRDYEVNFLRFVDRYTNGTHIEINETGTRVRLKPGVVVGGTFTHPCPASRGVGYWAEVLLLLAPFAKKPTEVTLEGVTNNSADIGADMLRTVTLPLLRAYGVEGTLKIGARGLPPGGGGRVTLSVEPVRKLRTVDLSVRGKVKRVRGVAFSARVSPDLAHRAVSAAKGLLLKLLPDVFVVADHFDRKVAGNSPGYGLTLVAESTSDQSVGLSEELVCASGSNDAGNVAAEDAGLTCAKLLLDQIKRGGCVDAHHQALALVLLALTPEEVSSVRLGPLTQAGEEALALCQDFFGVGFASKKDTSYHFSPTTVHSCIGTGLTNVSKKSS